MVRAASSAGFFVVVPGHDGVAVRLPADRHVAPSGIDAENHSAIAGDDDRVTNMPPTATAPSPVATDNVPAESAAWTSSRSR